MDTATSPPLATEPHEPAQPRIVMTPGTCGGKPRIAGCRITVKHIVLDYQRGGLRPDEIISAYPGLTLGDVHAALAYYFDHRDEIDADIRTDDDHWAKAEAEHAGSLAERLRRRKADVANHSIPTR